MIDQQRSSRAQPGVINNPKGINQYTGLIERGKSIACRLPIDLDKKFRTIIDEQGITATTALVEAIESWILKKTI
jgi:hypothetical protein